MSKQQEAEGERRPRRTYFVASADEHPDFFEGELPSVEQLVGWAMWEEDAEEEQETQAITVRPSVGEVALLDQIAKLFRQSRSTAARQLLCAAMRGVLDELPKDRRRDIEQAAATAAGWKVVVQKSDKVPDAAKAADGAASGTTQNSPSESDGSKDTSK